MPPHKEHEKFLFVLLRNSMHCIIVVFIYGFVVSMRLPFWLLMKTRKYGSCLSIKKIWIITYRCWQVATSTYMSKHLQLVLRYNQAISVATVVPWQCHRNRLTCLLLPLTCNCWSSFRPIVNPGFSVLGTKSFWYWGAFSRLTLNFCSLFFSPLFFIVFKDEFLGASRSYFSFLLPSPPYPLWNFLIFSTNYTKFLSLSLSYR